MKKLYLLFSLPLLLFFTGCSKDFLKSYDKRIVGTWHITDVNSIGIGNNSNLAFREGSFTFNSDGSLLYVKSTGEEYKGTWDIEKRQVNNDVMRSFRITAVDFSNQQVLGELYDEINFRGTDHFVADIHSTLRNYVTHFKR